MSSSNLVKINYEDLLKEIFVKFHKIPNVCNMEYLDILEAFIQNETNEQENDLFSKTFSDCLNKEISLLENRLKILKQKKYLFENQNWSKILINGQHFVKRLHDRFAYQIEDLSNPIYMWNGRSWIKLINDPNILQQCIE